MTKTEVIAFIDGMCEAKQLLEKPGTINHYQMMLDKMGASLQQLSMQDFSQFYFKPVDLKKCDYVPPWMTRSFASNKFIVMINDQAMTSKGEAIRVMIRNHLEQPIENHWKTIQTIKNVLFGKETTAIEYYPAESDLVDEHNIYWIWIFPKDILPKTFSK